jgi:hypothetical protein
MIYKSKVIYILHKTHKTTNIYQISEQRIVKLRKSLEKTQLQKQKSIASDQDMAREFEYRDKTSKHYRKKMLRISSSIVDNFLKKYVEEQKLLIKQK